MNKMRLTKSIRAGGGSSFRKSVGCRAKKSIVIRFRGAGSKMKYLMKQSEILGFLSIF